MLAKPEAMNQVTIFSLDNCKHCTRVKATLDARDVSFVEINLSSYPEKRVDMLSLTDRFTVPQVFFGSKHIGGADDTMALLDSWKTEDLLRSSLEKYFSQSGPLDKRLSRPATPPKETPPAPPRDESLNNIELPSGKQESVLEVTQKLMDSMPRSNLPWRARIYKDCFSGKEGVSCLMDIYQLERRSDAIQFGRTLQQSKILQHVTEDHEFDDTENYFRLQVFHQPNILNSFRVWVERVDPNHMGLLDRLNKLMSKISSSATDDSGLVDCKSALKDPNYVIFEEEVCELQGVEMGKMDEKTRLAFAINVYNLMIQHAFIKVGVPSTPMQRGSFYGSVCYNIGGDIFSFNELEHGVIRANTRPPYQLHSPFQKNDSRTGLALKELDPRIHFALNCGAKSCPPMKKFTSNGIDEELRIVAQAFCEDDANVSMDEGKNKLELSMIFSWYRADFSTSLSKLPLKVVQFLRGDRQLMLQRMIDSDSPIAVKFKTYDWNPIATGAKQYEPSKIDPNEMSLRSLVSATAMLVQQVSRKKRHSRKKTRRHPTQDPPKRQSLPKKVKKIGLRSAKLLAMKHRHVSKRSLLEISQRVSQRSLSEMSQRSTLRHLVQPSPRAMLAA